MDIQSLASVVPVQGEAAIDGLDYIGSGSEYLTFTLGDEHYGVDILSVKEIRGWENPTLIPNSPGHVKGVINIRGTIIPIIDLRIRFGVGEAEYSPVTVVIVLTTISEGKVRMMGFVVDTVSDVLNTGKNEIKPAPPFGTSIPPDMIEGMANVGQNVVTLLSIRQLLDLEDC